MTDGRANGQDRSNDLESMAAYADGAADLEPFTHVLELAYQNIRRHRPVILYGPPGTGKTYAIEGFRDRLYAEGVMGEFELVQFHRQHSYEDFIEGIRPVAGSTAFEFVDGSFKRFCGHVETLSASGTRPAGVVDLFVIDEINRADVAATLGETLYLIEDRIGRSVRTAHSGKEFAIPTSVAIVGTMNSADRSLAILDFALRRRFRFLPVYPDYAALEQWLRARGIDSEAGFDVDTYVAYAAALNANILAEPLLGKNMQLGHALFMPDAGRSNGPITVADIAEQMNTVVFPQLEAYAGFGQISLLGSLLGSESTAEVIRDGSFASDEECRDLIQALGG